MSTTRRAPVNRIRRATSDDSPRSRFRRPKHQLRRSRARHRKPVENDLTKPSHLLRYVVLAAATVLVALGVRNYGVQQFFIPSASMEPTLCGGPECTHGNDRILVNKLSYRLHAVDRGDIVVFGRPPALDNQTTDKDLVKRVIGVAGDTVRWDGQQLWLNGELQHESYVNPVCNGAAGSIAPNQVVVPAGDVFVMGDNRCNSEDGRYFGPIATSTIVGKVFMIVWPYQRIHLF